MFVLDTNILSAIMSVRPSPELAAWIAGQAEDALFTTTILSGGNPRRPGRHAGRPLSRSS
jgi:hypothetical protein